jgi:Hint domain
MSGTPDTFEKTVLATSGPLSGGYLWSNTNNWSDGVPVNGDAVSVPIGSGLNSYDDISSLDLASLTLSNQSYVGVVGSELTVTTVAGSAESQLTADAHLAGAPVTVTVGTISASDAYFGAYGAGARFVDGSTTDTGNFYYVSDGGFFELSATAPVSTSFFEYNGAGTLALNDPGTTNAFALEDLGAGDVLELPGTSVSNVSFGTNSLTVTTNDGSYDFTNVTYASGAAIDSYIAAYDASTGLEAITFGITDTFQDTTAATSSPFDGQYLWSNAANWNNGVPNNGDSVDNPTVGYDDIAALTLDSLSQAGGALTAVVGASLSVATVTGSGYLIADAYDAGAPVTVTVGTIDDGGGRYFAAGAGAVFVDQSTTDLGEDFEAYFGGLVKIAATPASTSTLDYYPSGQGTFALEDPGATNAVAIENLAAGDVLELPGTSVSSVTFGSDSLTVTTNDGSYDFTNVTYASGPTINSFTAAPDASTGLEAITFAICFCKGSLIRTPSGDVPVEKLSIGDIVTTWCGGAAPIRWIGRQTVSTRFTDPSRILPVRIKANALGDQIPLRDLLLSPDHAILIGDVLVQAGALINGTSIVRETNVPETFTYYHVELDDHSLVLAENTPAETFIDNVDRLGFDNWEEYEKLYPGGKPIVEMPYPRAKAHRQVPRLIGERLAVRFAALLNPRDVAA